MRKSLSSSSTVLLRRLIEVSPGSAAPTANTTEKIKYAASVFTQKAVKKIIAEITHGKISVFVSSIAAVFHSSNFFLRTSLIKVMVIAQKYATDVIGKHAHKYILRNVSLITYCGFLNTSDKAPNNTKASDANAAKTNKSVFSVKNSDASANANELTGISPSTMFVRI